MFKKRLYSCSSSWFHWTVSIKVLIIYSSLQYTFDTWALQRSHMVSGAWTWKNNFLFLGSFVFRCVCVFVVLCVSSCTGIARTPLLNHQPWRGNMTLFEHQTQQSSPEVSEIMNPSKQNGHFLEGSCWGWGYPLLPRRCLHQWGSLGLHWKLDYVALYTNNSSQASGKRCTSSQSPAGVCLLCTSCLTIWRRGQW